MENRIEELKREIGELQAELDTAVTKVDALLQLLKATRYSGVCFCHVCDLMCNDAKQCDTCLDVCCHRCLHESICIWCRTDADDLRTVPDIHRSET